MVVVTIFPHSQQSSLEKREIQDKTIQSTSRRELWGKKKERKRAFCLWPSVEADLESSHLEPCMVAKANHFLSPRCIPQ